MARVFRALSRILRPGAPAIFVVGHSTWNSVEIPTSALFREISAHLFSLEKILSYPIKNRYMSYSRHNGADITVEYVCPAAHAFLGRRKTGPPSKIKVTMPMSISQLADDISKLGTESKQVSVEISYEIVRLFSEQLYASPVKAIEELVVNGWDAGARVCSVLVDVEANIA